jgi:hypothetical protein
LGKKLGAVFNHRILHELNEFFVAEIRLNSLIIKMVAGGGIAQLRNPQAPRNQLPMASLMS